MALPEKRPIVSEKLKAKQQDKQVAVIILAGGEGKRLHPLTHYRCKPAVNFGGRYCLIDVPLSHSLNSGFERIYVLGQYLSHTLSNHLTQSYYHRYHHIQLLVPESKGQESNWYEGTADAIRKNLPFFEQVVGDYFLILSGDQLYNIDFNKMVEFGIHTDADVVIASLPVSKKEAPRLGLLKLKEKSAQVENFLEKPKDETLLEPFYLKEGHLQALKFSNTGDKHYLGSMGIYLFKREVLFDLLKTDERNDFGKHLIKELLGKCQVHAFLYNGYWEDIGTIESYYQANLNLTLKEKDYHKALQCYEDIGLIMTKPYRLPGAKIGNTKIEDSVICEGSVVYAKEVLHSILGVRSVIGENTRIKDSVLLGNEFYQSTPLYENAERFAPHIGSDCLIQHAIVDENVVIGPGCTIVNQNNYLNYDDPSGIVVRDGITIIPKNLKLPAGFVF